MRSNRALLKNLRKLSPFFNELVNEALKRKIRILAINDVIKKFPLRHQRHVSEDFKEKTLGAGRFNKLRLEKTIILRWPEFKYFSQWPEFKKSEKFSDVSDKDLGIAEMCFCHEIGHNLFWDIKPPCSLPVSLPPRFIRCAYCEIFAWHMGLKIAESRDSNVWGGHPFKGKNASRRTILYYLGVPWELVGQSWKCPAIELRQLKRCPKQSEIIEIAESIEKKLKSSELPELLLLTMFFYFVNVGL